jgi:hypothetical protein
VANRPASARQALEALEQLDRRPLPVASTAAAVPPRKPADSRIQLHKPEQIYEEVIRASQLRALVAFAIVWNAFIAFFTIMAVVLAPFPVNRVAVLLMLPLWKEGLAMVIKILSSLSGKTHLNIESLEVVRFRGVTPGRQAHTDRLELILTRRDSNQDRVIGHPGRQPQGQAKGSARARAGGVDFGLNRWLTRLSGRKGSPQSR